MKPTLTLLAALLVTGSAGAGEVYVTRDAQGNPVYTDTPQSIPAQKLDIRSSSTDPAEVQARYAEQMQRQSADEAAKAQAAASATDAGRARTLTAEDRARRCVEARQRYEAVMGSYRVYEEGPDGQRRYLSSAEIDTARADARQLMDQFCSDQ